MDNRTFSCSDCLSKYDGRNDAETMTAALRRVKACEVSAPAPLHFIDDKKIGFSRCVGNFVSKADIHWIEMHAHFKRGILPYPGSLSDQPAKVMEIFGVIDEHQYVSAKKRADEMNKKRSPGGKRGR